MSHWRSSGRNFHQDIPARCDPLTQWSDAAAQIPPPMTGLRPVNDDIATRNARAEFFETSHLRSDLGPDLFSRLAIPKRDLDWRLHFFDPSLAERLSLAR